MYKGERFRLKNEQRKDKFTRMIEEARRRGIIKRGKHSTGRRKEVKKARKKIGKNAAAQSAFPLIRDH